MVCSLYAKIGTVTVLKGAQDNRTDDQEQQLFISKYNFFLPFHVIINGKMKGLILQCFHHRKEGDETTKEPP